MDTPENIRRRMSALRDSRVATDNEAARQRSAQQSCLSYIQADCPHHYYDRVSIGMYDTLFKCRDCFKEWQK